MSVRRDSSIGQELGEESVPDLSGAGRRILAPARDTPPPVVRRIQTAGSAGRGHENGRIGARDRGPALAIEIGPEDWPMKRLLLAFVLVAAIGRGAEARPAPRPAKPTVVLQSVRVIHPIPHQPKHKFVWFVVNKIVVPAAVGAAEVTVRGAIVAAL